MAEKRFWGSLFKKNGVFLIGRVQNRFKARNSTIRGRNSHLKCPKSDPPKENVEIIDIFFFTFCFFTLLPGVTFGYEPILYLLLWLGLGHY